MKVAILMSSMSFGGAQRVTALLANYWAARGEDVCLLTIDSSAGDCYETDSRVRRIALALSGESQSPGAALAANWRRITAIRRAVLEFGADAVLSFGDQTNVLAVIATRGTRVRCIVAEVTDPARHAIGTLWNVLRRVTYPMACGLVVQTRALLPWARSVMVRGRKAHAIRNPVRDMQRYARAEREGSRRALIAVGRLSPEKGLDVLLKAFASVADEFPSWSLVLVGEGPERSVLMQLAHDLGISRRVCFQGWISEPGEALAQSDLFVMPSRYEGFPNALLEAMACGLPAIATANVGAAEIITPEVDGLLVPVDSVSELASALRNLMADDSARRRLAAAARAVSHRYSLKAVVQEWDQVLSCPPVGNEVCRA